MRPLADLLRPSELDGVVGQTHILKKGAMLQNVIENGNIRNMVFFGPSGV